jgi:hypothetical protein
MARLLRSPSTHVLSTDRMVVHSQGTRQRRFLYPDRESMESVSICDCVYGTVDWGYDIFELICASRMEDYSLDEYFSRR